VSQTDASQIGNRAWSFAHVLRDDGLSYQAYIEQITFLLFLKMADEVTKPPFKRKAIVPEPWDWPNLLPACKNIGTTHITNGCYRLHPVEWNIGESAAFPAAFCLDRDTTPAEVHENPSLLQDFQKALVEQGVGLEWPSTFPV